MFDLDYIICYTYNILRRIDINAIFINSRILNMLDFKDLSETAKTNAIQNIRNSGDTVFEGWWQPIYDDATTYLKTLGFEVLEFSFSGLGGQGAGASFDAIFDARLIDTEALKEHAPEVYEQIKNSCGFFFEEVGAPKDLYLISRTRVLGYRPYKSYEFCYFEIDDSRLDIDELESEIEFLLEEGVDEQDAKILELQQHIANADGIVDNIEKWVNEAHEVLSSILYKSLEDEYEWLNSDNTIIEHIQANDLTYSHHQT